MTFFITFHVTVQTYVNIKSRKKLNKNTSNKTVICLSLYSVKLKDLFKEINLRKYSHIEVKVVHKSNIGKRRHTSRIKKPKNSTAITWISCIQIRACKQIFIDFKLLNFKTKSNFNLAKTGSFKALKKKFVTL